MDASNIMNSAEADREAIAKVLDGDYRAFEFLVDKYEGRIFRHIRKMVKDNQLAEDLLQETFLNAYRGLSGFTGSSTFSTWLFRIATNNALMHLRKNRPEQVEYEDDFKSHVNESLLMASPQFLSTPLDNLLSAEGREKIEEAIDSLPVMYRSVIILRDVEGFSLEETAEVVQSSVAAVKSRLHRARNAVRQELMSYYAERPAPAAQAKS